jgi:predicted dinucleotide-binding enzyme
MKIAVLGSGMVGQTLAKGIKGLGHDVRIGSREGAKLAAFSAETGVAEGRFADVVAFADVVILAVKGDVAESLVAQLKDTLASKVVLDTTNPIAGAPVEGMLPYFTGADESLIERLQKSAPNARFVKWFNSVGAGLMVGPKLSGGAPSMFICGNDADAKKTATQLASEMGWSVEDAGSAKLGHALEALCQLWCAFGFTRNDWAHAFAMLRP